MDLKFKGFEGGVKFKEITYLERTRFVSDCQNILSEDIPSGEQSYRIVEKTYELATKLLESVELKHNKSKRVFKSLEELGKYKEFGDVMTDIATYLREGPALGNG